jgi:hypothetical protein
MTSGNQLLLCGLVQEVTHGGERPSPSPMNSHQGSTDGRCWVSTVAMIQKDSQICIV